MRQVVSVLCPLLCLLGTVLAAHDNNFCTITQPQGVSLPTAPNAYQVTMTIRDDSGYRSSAIEYFDGTTQASSYQTFTPEGSYRVIFNFVTNQAQLIDMNNVGKLLDSCQVQSITPADVLTAITLGTKKTLLPSKFFFGGNNINVATDPTSDINGVPVNSYASCYYWASADTSLKLMWHYTKTTRPQPVRITIEAKDNSNGMRTTTTYDIGRFLPGTQWWTARVNPYMAPPGLYCRNLISQGRKPQSLPNKFSMRIERIAAGSSTPTYLKEAYDFNSNMSLLLGYPPETSGDSTKYGAGVLLYIHDFRRGLSYIRNEDMGNCTYERLSAADWDSQKDGNQLRIRTPREFFDLDNDNVQYKGTGYTRDILTDIFITYKQMDLGVSGLTSLTTLEWYFTNRTYIDPESKATVIQSIPMNLLVTSEASWLNSTLYIYDFDQKDPIFNRHDISACFANDAKKHYQLFFPLPNEKTAQYLRGNPNEFTSLLIPIIAGGLRVSPLRVLDPDVTVSGSTCILELTVTDKPRFQTDEEETPLREIEAAFNILISKSSVFTMVKVENDFVLLTANKVSAIEERTNNLKSIGYSAGALVGIGFAMVILGLALGVGVIFGIYKFRGEKLTGFDPFQPQRI